MAQRKVNLSSRQKADKAQEVIRLRFQEGKSVEEVCERLDLSYPAMVSRLVKYARDNKLFSIKFSKELEPTRNIELEKKLIEVFGLRRAIVVDLDFIDNDNKIKSSLKDDDILHETLGKVLAQVLERDFEIGIPRSIGVGGGRGPYYFAKAFYERTNDSRKYKEQSSRTTIKSLTGTVMAGVWDQDGANRHLLLDAQHVTNFLGKSLGIKDSNLFYLNFPLVYKDSSDREIILKLESANYLTEDIWKKERPELSVVGIGILHPESGHRFVKPFVFFPHSIKEDLKKLRENVEKAIREYGYCPVGDICNYLFFIDPPQKKHENSKLLNNIKNLVNKFNKQLLTIDLDQLSTIPNVIGIAGGVDYKTDAIFHVLEKKKILHILCTDSLMANKLIELKLGTDWR